VRQRAERVIGVLRARRRHVAALALVVAALSIPRVASSPTWLVLAGGLAAAAVVVAMTRWIREVWLTGLPAVVVLVTVVVGVADTSAWPDLVWERADQIALTETAFSLLAGDANRFHYLLALPAGLAAIITVSGFSGTAIDVANSLNLVLLPVTVGVIVPASFGLFGRSVVRGPSATVWATLLAIPTALYLAFPPDWVPERNAALVPLRLTGLVYAPEVLALLLAAIGAYVLARRTWSWTILGVTMGSIVAVHERHLLIAAPLVCLLFTLDRRCAARTSLVAAACLVPQLMYFRLVYGGWFFPNRSHVWDQRTASWARRASDRYDVGTDAPNRLDLAYVSTNLPDVLAGTWWLWLPAAVGFVAALLLRRSDWRLWLFCGALTAVVVVSSAAYINLVVQWRYNFLAIPLMFLPGVAALAGSWAIGRRQRSPTEPPLEELAVSPELDDVDAAGGA
jgi:hypothetical protein